jgi:GT2 family glycosyltransferase
VVPPKIRLVVLNYNGGALVERCVDHLEALDWPADRLEIVVVDNASTDGSPAALARRPRVRLVSSPDNTGFPANNLALGDLDGIDYVGLINNDAFVEPDYLAPLVAALEEGGTLGAACPKILLAHRFVDLHLRSAPWAAPGDGRALGVKVSGLEVGGEDRWRHALPGAGVHAMEAGGADEPRFCWTDGDGALSVPAQPTEPTARIRVSAPRELPLVLDAGAGEVAVIATPTPTWVEVPLGSARHDVINNVGSRLLQGGWGGDRGFLEVDHGQYDQPQEVFAWCGAGVLFRPDYLRDVGLFDERFFMYYEDTDLAWRGRLRGWRYRYVPTALLRHVHAATSVEGSPMFNHYVQRNRLLMLTKNAPPGLVVAALVGVVRELAGFGVRDIVRPVLGGRRPTPRFLLGRLRSLGAYLRLLPAFLATRREVRGARRVPDAAILGWAE